MEEELNLERMELVSYLRNTLKNSTIEITYEVSKIEDKTRLYTNRDKYNRMVEINPLLQTLKQKLDLDID